MGSFLRRVWDELSSRFTEEEQTRLKRIVAVRLLYRWIFGFCVGVVPCIPWLVKYLGWTAASWLGWGLPLLFSLVHDRFSRTIDFMKKARKTWFRKLEIVWFVLGMVMCILIVFSMKKLTVDEGIRAFGREVQLPSYTPFAVREADSEMYYQWNELVIHYYGDSSFIHRGPWMDIYISTRKLPEWRGEKVKLKNGTVASIYRNSGGVIALELEGLWYEIWLAKDDSEYDLSEFIKVVESFKPYKSRSQ